MKKKKILPTGALEEDFSLSLFKKLIDELRSYDNFREISISFSGGEPFLNPEIFEILRYAKESDVRLTLYTNGTLPLESWLSKLFAFPSRFLMFSIDGPRLEHDQIRGAGNFDKTIEAIKEIQIMKKVLGFRLPFIISNTVINKLNVNSFDEVLNLAEELGIDTLFFSFVQWSNKKMAQLAKDEFASRLKWQGGWSRLVEGSQHPYGRLNGEEIDALIKKINKIKNTHSQNRQIQFRPDFSSDEEIRKWFSDTCGKVDICESVYSDIRINFDGDVFPACANILFPLGNIKFQSLKEILEGEKAHLFLSEIEKNGYFYACQRCCRRSGESRTI